MNKLTTLKFPYHMTLLCIFSLLLLTSCSEEDYEIEVPVSAVPDKVLTAVNNKFNGIQIMSAEIESKAEMHYELEGKLNGKEYEFEVKPDGSIIEIEIEQEDETN